MGVVCANKVNVVALHSLVPHPNIGLDVFHDVANVEIAIGVGQGGGDKKLARHGQLGKWGRGVAEDGNAPKTLILDGSPVLDRYQPKKAQMSSRWAWASEKPNAMSSWVYGLSNSK